MMTFEVPLMVATVMPYPIAGITAFIREMVFAAFAVMMSAASR